MSTTSGRRSATIATALSPSGTEAATSISWRSSRRSSSASRKTSLSSTSRTRIGSAMGRTLLGRKEKRVVRLAALVDVDLEARVLLGELVEEAVQRRCVLAGEDGEDVARLGEQ